MDGASNVIRISSEAHIMCHAVDQQQTDLNWLNFGYIEDIHVRETPIGDEVWIRYCLINSFLLIPFLDLFTDEGRERHEED